MRRNPIRRSERRAERQALIEAKPAAAVLKGKASTANQRQAGGNDPVSGEWVAYGLVGVTAVGDFRVKGS